MTSFVDRLAGAMGFKAAVADPVNARAMPYAIFAQHAGQNITSRQAWMLYKSVGTFAKVVDLIADEVANLTPTVVVDGELRSNDNILEFLKQPGFGRTRRRFMKELAVQYLVTGTAYLHAIGSTKAAPVAFDILPTRFCSHIEGADGWPDAYHFHEPRVSHRFQREGNRDFRYVEDMFGEVVPIYDSQGDSRGIGLSRLQAVRDEVEMKMQGMTHNRSLLSKGARLTGVLAFKSSLVPDQKQAVLSDLAASSSGAHNAGGVMVTGGGEAEFINMMMSPRDMDWAQLVKSVDETLAARYSVPVTLFAVDAQTHNNYETAWEMLYDNAILPTFGALYDGIAQLITNRSGMMVEFKHDELSSSVLAKKAVDHARVLMNTRIITPNEARELVGYEPFVGGDSIWDMPGLVPQFNDIFADHLGTDGPTEPRALEAGPGAQAPAGTALN